jgi:hypothetical protein
MSEDENKIAKIKALKEVIKKSEANYVGLNKNAQKDLKKAFEITPKPPKKDENSK